MPVDHDGGGGSQGGVQGGAGGAGPAETGELRAGTDVQRTLVHLVLGVRVGLGVENVILISFTTFVFKKRALIKSNLVSLITNQITLP